jgi:hypothetical protein
LRFRVAGLRDLGLFEVVSSSWELAEHVAELAGVLGRTGGDVECVLALETVGFVTSSGVGASYRRPVVEVGAGGRGGFRLAA